MSLPFSGQCPQFTEVYKISKGPCEKSDLSAAVQN
jgi:hypothetical protein